MPSLSQQQARLEALRRTAEQRQAEADCLSLSLLVSSIHDYAIFMLDPSGCITSWNTGAERITGYAADEAIGRHFSMVYLPEDVRAGSCDLEMEITRREGRYENEGWRIRKDGTRFWANAVITALRDADGKLVGFGKVTRDLTERRRAEQERLAAEERFRRMIESVRDHAVLMLDPAGNLTTWNIGAERIKGYRADEIVGRHFSVFYPEEDRHECAHALELAASAGWFEHEGWQVRKDGSRFWANVVISPIRDEGDGRVVGFSKVTRDLTERKRAEEESALRFAAEEASRTKDQFLAMLGHELRNPLAPILTALQLIKLRGDSRCDREHDVIERQVRHLNRLVDDLLDVSRIAQGKIELVRIPLDVRIALAKAVEIATPFFEKKAQHFEVTSPPHPLIVQGDEARLVQIFTNLLTNASKYTPRGGRIALVVGVEDDQVAIEVCDDGAGIDAELLPRIFELFVQGKQDSARGDGGLGLGLSLVQQLVHMHGGDVVARSKGPGRGSTFRVVLPHDRDASAAAEHEEPPLVVAAQQAKRRVLLVDDNEDARMLLGEMLAAAGHEVTQAADGFEALAALDTHRPEVAILDIGLPRMDGYQLAARIRETEHGRDVRLIALTGYGQPQDHARSRQAGFDEHVVKPVDLKRLLGLVAGAATC